MDPVITKILEGVPYNGMGSTLERNALIGVIRNLIKDNKYTVDYILNYAQSVGYQRQMAEDVFKELTGLSPKLIVNNNEYYNMPAYVPNMCIAWGKAKSKKDTAFYVVPFEYGYSVMEKDEVNAPISTIICATIPEAIDELKKVAKNIQTLDKIITEKLLETEDVITDAKTTHQVNLPYNASPLQVLKKNFKDKVINVSEFERQASKLLASEEITVDEAEDLMAWKEDLIDEDETYGNDVLELDEQWNEVQATLEFEDVYNEYASFAEEDKDITGDKERAKQLFEENPKLFKNVDLIEAASRLYQLFLGFTPEDILGKEKVEKKMDKKSAIEYKEITQDEWNDKKKHGYTLIDNGIKYILTADERGTVLQPVKIIKSSKEVPFYDLICCWDSIRMDIVSCGEVGGLEKFELDGVEFYKAKDEELENAIDTCLKKEFMPEWKKQGLSYYIIMPISFDDATGKGKVELKLGWPESKRYASKKVTAENMTLEDIEEENSKDQVQEEIEKIEEKPAEEIFSETTPEQYLDEALAEDKVDTINEVVSKCIDKFAEKFKDFDKYTVKILSYNTKVLGDYKPNTEEMVEDKELNANAILQVILSITNNADETSNKKALAVFSITNGELHWTGTIRGENNQVVAFTEEGLDSFFEVEDIKQDELEDII